MALRANAETTKLNPYTSEPDTSQNTTLTPCLDIVRISELLLTLFQSEETPSAVLQKFMVVNQTSNDHDLKTTAEKVDGMVSEELKSTIISCDASESPNLLVSKDLNITNEAVVLLPNELWIAVFSCLDDLSASRLTCRQWNALILEHPLTCTKLFKKAFGCNPNLDKGPVVTQFNNIQFNIEKQIYSESEPTIFNPLFSDKTISLLSGNLLLVCHSENDIVRQVWDISDSTPKKIQTVSLLKNLETLTSVSILLNTSHLVNSNEIISLLISPKCKCVMFDLTANTLCDLFELSHQKSFPTCVDFKQDAKKRFVAIGFDDGKCEIWDFATRLRVRDFQFDAPISSVCLDIATGRLAVGYKHGLVEVWDTKTKPDVPQRRLGSYEMFHAPVKHLCIQGNIIAAGSKAEQAHEDEIILTAMHLPKSLNSISLPEIAWLTLQGTQLVVIHGNPLQIRRLDFSVSHQEFFLNLNLNSLLFGDDERKLELLQHHFFTLPKSDQKEIHKIYHQLNPEQKKQVEQGTFLGDDHESSVNLQEFINAINTHYSTSAKLST